MKRMRNFIALILICVMSVTMFTGCGGTYIVYDDGLPSYSSSSSNIASRFGASAYAVNSNTLNQVAEVIIEGAVRKSIYGYSTASVKSYINSQSKNLISIGASEGFSESQMTRAISNGKYAISSTYAGAVSSLASKYPYMLANASYYGFASRQVSYKGVTATVVVVVYLN